jgi:hypothetical protein
MNTIHQSERNKAEAMRKEAEERRKAFNESEKRRKNPYKGTNYPKNYRSYIPTPLPEVQKSEEEIVKEEIRKVSVIVNKESTCCPARFK